MSAPPLLAEDTAGLIAWQLAPLLAVALLYGRRARAVGRSGAPVPAWRQAAFHAGLLTAALAVSALDRPSDELLVAHAVEHLLIGDLAALLLVLGLTGPLLAPVVRGPLGGTVRTLANPLIALPVWALTLCLWQLPSLSHAALEHSGVHALAHATLLLVGVNMWMCLLGPLPTPRWFDDHARLGYVLAVRLAGAALGNVLLWSGTVFYPFYIGGELARHISPLADQNAAGAVILVEQSLMAVGLFVWLYLRAGTGLHRATLRAPGERAEGRTAGRRELLGELTRESAKEPGGYR
ncbi:MAG: cytochrome c oxidase assembly protein [Solirubrobacterales bacterium]|nr:cytochrome c oxidase assembly protein [Solirubrobacterales bacterium]